MDQGNLKKEYYTIGEVSQIVGVQQHVLRNWEREIGFLKPKKKESGHRLYHKKDLEIALRIKELLYEELYTINGAKKRLWQELKRGEAPPVDILFSRIRRDLEEIKKIIKGKK
ncbi:MAG: MerR family transcriptional regulator [bacterium]|nr:MerR family transcriptional regulator [bacterium]